MKSKAFRRVTAGITAVLVTAAYVPAVIASADVPDFGAVTEMPTAPFGTAGENAPYHAKPCNERLATLPEALMKLTDDGYTWSGDYGAGKPTWALTLMDYANIYSYIHTHDIDADTLRAVLEDGDSMLHKKPFTAEEIELLLGDDEAAAMAAFASPSTIVIGEKGYCAKWMYYHTVEEYAAEGITPEMVAAVLPYYYNALYVQEAADAFSQKLSQYAGQLGATKWHQWKAGDINIDGTINDDDTALLTAFLADKAALTFTQWASADMDGNSDVNEADLTALKEKIDAGIEDSGVMLDVIEFCQYPDYPTGCESVSLYMLLDYYDVDVTVDNIYDLLPMGAQPYDDENGVRHGANPEREFVGDPRSDYSYGVFNEPIAAVAEQFKPGVKTERGVTVDKIKEILDTGHPVLAWYVSAPMRDIMYRWTWLDERGELVTWPGGEHAVVVCGYDEDSITYRDPNAGTTVCIDYATFEKSFNELGGRIVYYTDEEAEAVSYIAESGVQMFAQPTALTGSETAPEAGWYAVSGDVTVDSDLALSGDVKLILADGAALTVNGGISGDGTLTVYGQTEGTGTLNGKTVSVSSYAQYGGKVTLTSDTEFALTGSESVSLLGGQFAGSAGVSSEGTITLGFMNETDSILAGKYAAEKVVAAENQALYIPDFPKDFSLDTVSGSISVTYNGEEQSPAKKNVIGNAWFNEPIYSGVISDSNKKLQFAQNRTLVPYPEAFDPDLRWINTPLGEDDFEIGEAESAKYACVPGTGELAYYMVELIGKGAYFGSTVIDWFMQSADVSGDITVTPKAPIISDGSPVTAEDFEITASSPLAQVLVDEIADGKAQAQIGFYSAEPLTGDDITSECKADTALEKGHIYDLNDLGAYMMLMISDGENLSFFTAVSPGKLNDSIYVIKNGERMNGCVEIDEDGALCYYEVNKNGEDTYLKGEQTPYMYWHIQKTGSSDIMPIYYLKQDFTEAQRTEVIEPGDYVARMIISETDSYNYDDVTKIIPFTVEENTTPPDESEQIAPDETLLRWAETDYEDKTGTDVTAFPIEKADGTMLIALKDSEGNHVMSYEIDTATGIGTDDNGEEVNLPQTGNNSLTNLILAVMAFMMMIAGGYAVHASGILRRKTLRK